MPKIQVGDLVGVLWEDAWANSRWQDTPPKNANGIFVESVGFFVRRNKSGIFMSSGRALQDSANEWADMHYVPTGMVKRVRLLRKCQKRFL